MHINSYLTLKDDRRRRGDWCSMPASLVPKISESRVAKLLRLIFLFTPPPVLLLPPRDLAGVSFSGGILGGLRLGRGLKSEAASLF